MKKILMRLMLVMLIAVFLTSAVYSELLIYEPFDYPVGVLDGCRPDPKKPQDPDTNPGFGLDEWSNYFQAIGASVEGIVDPSGDFFLWCGWQIWWVEEDCIKLMEGFEGCEECSTYYGDGSGDFSGVSGDVFLGEMDGMGVDVCAKYVVVLGCQVYCDDAAAGSDFKDGVCFLGYDIFKKKEGVLCRIIYMVIGLYLYFFIGKHGG